MYVTLPYSILSLDFLLLVHSSRETRRLLTVIVSDTDSLHVCACRHLIICVLGFQSKALIPLQTEAHPETKQRVLTNYMFPQQPRGDEGKLSVEVLMSLQ